MAGNDTRDSKEGGLAWADISLYVGGKRGRWILRRVHGHAKPGESRFPKLFPSSSLVPLFGNNGFCLKTEGILVCHFEQGGCLQ